MGAVPYEQTTIKLDDIPLVIYATTTGLASAGIGPISPPDEHTLRRHLAFATRRILNLDIPSIDTDSITRDPHPLFNINTGTLLPPDQPYHALQLTPIPLYSEFSGEPLNNLTTGITEIWIAKRIAFRNRDISSGALGRNPNPNDYHTFIVTDAEATQLISTGEGWMSGAIAKSFDLNPSSQISLEQQNKLEEYARYST